MAAFVCKPLQQGLVIIGIGSGVWVAVVCRGSVEAEQRAVGEGKLCGAEEGVTAVPRHPPGQQQHQPGEHSQVENTTTTFLPPYETIWAKNYDVMIYVFLAIISSMVRRIVIQDGVNRSAGVLSGICLVFD